MILTMEVVDRYESAVNIFIIVREHNTWHFMGMSKDKDREGVRFTGTEGQVRNLFTKMRELTQ